MGLYRGYNEAVQYLKNQLGTIEFYSGYGTKNRPFNVTILYLYDKIIPYSNEHLIHLLLTQYSCSLTAQKELHYKMIELGIISENKN